MDIWKNLDALRGIVASEKLSTLVLKEAAHQEGVAEKVSNASELLWRDFRKSAEYPYLQAAARALLQLNARDKLRAIDRLNESFRDRVSGLYWMARVPAEQIAEAAAPFTSVRCSFEFSMHPALHIAVDALENSKPKTVLFITRSQEICDIAKLCAVIIGVELDVVCGDPLGRQEEGSVEFEICFPPFGEKIIQNRNIAKSTLNLVGAEDASMRLGGEAIAIADILVHTKGSAIIGLSDGAMFRTVGIEALARDELIASGRLGSILSIPAGMIYNFTMIGSNLVFLEKADHERTSVRFVDLSSSLFSSKGPRGRYEARPDVSWVQAISSPLTDEEKFARDVSLDEITAQAGILTIDRYLGSEAGAAVEEFLSNYECRSLGEVVEMIRPLAIKKSDDGEHTIYEASPADIAETGYLKRPSRSFQVDRSNFRKLDNQKVMNGDVLISIKGTIGVIGIVDQRTLDPLENETCAAGQSLMILRTRSALISPVALYEYLSDDVVREYLRSLSGGVSIQSLNIKDLKTLRIPLPDIKTQHQVEHDFYERQRIFNKIDKLREEITNIRSDTWPHKDLKDYAAEE